MFLEAKLIPRHVSPKVSYMRNEFRNVVPLRNLTVKPSVSIIVLPEAFQDDGGQAVGSNRPSREDRPAALGEKRPLADSPKKE